MVPVMEDKTYTKTLIQHWDSLVADRTAEVGKFNKINGQRLSLATVVAVSRYCTPISISLEAEDTIRASANVLQHSLAQGLVVYGVNTGFGGSADTRTSNVEALQSSLIRMLQSGVLTNSTDRTQNSYQNGHCSRNSSHVVLPPPLPLDDPSSATCMPESWSRASMLIRLNSLTSGSSGVQLSTVQTLAALLNHNIVPQIPLRGSISASGDLSPLSYIGGAMQGLPTVKVWAGDRMQPGERKLMRAREALRKAKISPVSLGAKEGLAIVNGTAVSAGVAALGLHEAHCQAALSQVLTAMSVEALLGTDESFNAFIAQIRPHPGQIDSARNIFSFLADSKLIHHEDGTEDMTLRQDRYSIRTASQWIGPVLEDLLLAHQQLAIELNSVTDNPVINIETGGILHGGNFQAKSVSSAMEKTRAGIQTIGRMLFAQCTELINPVMNRGLPPNLVVDDPSTSFIWKGTDIMVAALASELGFLASPVAPHVQTAEMGNQALNSLALISARYTLTAVDVLTQLSAAHLLALCQALDLRALQYTFLTTLEPKFTAMVIKAYALALPNDTSIPTPTVVKSSKILWAAFRRRMEVTMSMDPGPRIHAAVEALQPLLLKEWPASTESVIALRMVSEDCASISIEVFEDTRKIYRANPDATPLLGRASKRMYLYVRKVLEVPFFGEHEITVPDDKVKEVKSMVNGSDKEKPTVVNGVTKLQETATNMDGTAKVNGMNGTKSTTPYGSSSAPDKATLHHNKDETQATNPTLNGNHKDHHTFTNGIHMQEEKEDKDLIRNNNTDIYHNGENDEDLYNDYDDNYSDQDQDQDYPTVGGYITKIYEAMRSGDLYAEMIECFREVGNEKSTV